jgi:hypothetical protein
MQGISVELGLDPEGKGLSTIAMCLTLSLQMHSAVLRWPVPDTIARDISLSLKCAKQ